MSMGFARNGFRIICLVLSICLVTDPSWAFVSVNPTRQSLSILNQLERTLPPSMASVSTHFQSTSGGSPVILIKDVHLNYQAQQRIVNILNWILDQTPVQFIGVEGAFDAFDFSPFQAAKAPVSAEIADGLLRNNRIAATTYVGLTRSHSSVVFYGIDDFESYRDHVAALLSARKKAGLFSSSLKSLRENLESVTQQVLSEPLRDLVLARQRYDENKSSITNTLETIVQLNRPPQRQGHRHITVEDIPKKYPQLRCLFEAHALEKKLDQEKISSEQVQFLSRLSKYFGNDALQHIIREQKSTGAPSGTLGRLLTWAQHRGIDVASYEHAWRYHQYVVSVSRIQIEQVQNELLFFANEVANGFIRNSYQREVWDRWNQLSLLERLKHFSLIPQQWMELKATPISEIERGRHRIFDSPGIRAQYVRPFMEFYQQADVRSVRMVENLLNKSNPSDLKRPTVVVVGGFHVKWMTHWLEQHRVPYLVLSPKLSSGSNDHGSAYLSNFSENDPDIKALFKQDPRVLGPKMIRRISQNGQMQNFLPLLRVQAIGSTGLTKNLVEKYQQQIIFELKSPTKTLKTSAGKLPSNSPLLLLPIWKKLLSWVQSRWPHFPVNPVLFDHPVGFGVLVPVLELPLVPGLSWGLCGLVGPMAGVLMSASIFSLLHGHPARHQTWEALGWRFVSSLGIYGASTLTWLIDPTALSSIFLSALVASLLHAWTNLAVEAEFRLALPYFSSRVPHPEEKLRGQFHRHVSFYHALRQHGDFLRLARLNTIPSSWIKSFLIRDAINALSSNDDRRIESSAVLLALIYQKGLLSPFNETLKKSIETLIHQSCLLIGPLSVARSNALRILSPTGFVKPAAPLELSELHILLDAIKRTSSASANSAETDKESYRHFNAIQTLENLILAGLVREPIAIQVIVNRSATLLTSETKSDQAMQLLKELKRQFPWLVLTRDQLPPIWFDSAHPTDDHPIRQPVSPMLIELVKARLVNGINIDKASLSHRQPQKPLEHDNVSEEQAFSSLSEVLKSFERDPVYKAWEGQQKKAWNQHPDFKAALSKQVENWKDQLASRAHRLKVPPTHALVLVAKNNLMDRARLSDLRLDATIEQLGSVSLQASKDAEQALALLLQSGLIKKTDIVLPVRQVISHVRQYFDTSATDLKRMMAESYAYCFLPVELCDSLMLALSPSALEQMSFDRLKQTVDTLAHGHMAPLETLASTALQGAGEWVGHLKSISLSENGDAVANFLRWIPLLFTNPFQFERPKNAPFKKPVVQAEIPLFENPVIELGADRFDVRRAQLTYGRTAVYEPHPWRNIHLKFWRRGELLSNLVYEHDMITFLQSKIVEWNLQGQYPRPRLALGRLPVALAPPLPGIMEEDGYVFFTAYETDRDMSGQIPFLTYLNDPDLSYDEFTSAFKINIHDRLTLARYGFFDTEVIELFHNRENGTRREYDWFVDVYHHDPFRSGAGRLDDVVGATLYPNGRLSGLADFASLVFIGDLFDDSLDALRSDKRIERLQMLVRDDRQKGIQLLWAALLGDQILSLALMPVTYLLRRGELSYSQATASASPLLEESLVLLFHQTERLIARKNLVPNLSQACRLAASQLAYFVSSQYVKDHYMAQLVPSELYPGTLVYGIKPGRGWKELRGWDLQNITHTIPSRNPSIRFPMMSRDLGPVNGPNPAQELIRLMYVVIPFAAAFRNTTQDRHDENQVEKLIPNNETQVKSIPDHASYRRASSGT